MPRQSAVFAAPRICVLPAEGLLATLLDCSICVSSSACHDVPLILGVSISPLLGLRPCASFKLCSKSSTLSLRVLAGAQEEIMRQLLACLVHVGLSFPERPASQRSAPPAPDLGQLVDCFRAGEPLPAAASGHSRRPSGGSAGAQGRWWGGPSPPRTPPPTPPPPGAHVRGVRL